MNDTSDSLARLISLLLPAGASEEDVKIRIVMPFLRAFGYHDDEFGYEGRTGRGYVDIANWALPVGIVVEAKGPRRRLSDHLEQLESYVFAKHSRDRATVAILTNGDEFRMFGVTEAFYRGSLQQYELERFRRSDLADPTLPARLTAVLDKDRNRSGLLFDALNGRLKEVREMRERVQAIEAQLETLSAERQRIDGQIQELQSERAALLGTERTPGPPTPTVPRNETSARTSGDNLTRVGIPHILRLLHEKGATSPERAVQRTWLDQSLIGKVHGIETHQEVSFSLIELKRAGKVDYDKRGSGPIRSVWLR